MNFLQFFLFSLLIGSIVCQPPPKILDRTQMGSSSNDLVKDVLSLNEDYFVIAGETDGVLHGSNSGMRDVFAEKHTVYDVNDVKWGFQRGSTMNDYVNDICYDNSPNSQNEVFLIGYTEGDLPSHTSYGGEDTFVMTLNDTSGAFMFSYQVFVFVFFFEICNFSFQTEWIFIGRQGDCVCSQPG